MKLSDFNFELPEDRLAEFPAENRDESRLMVLNEIHLYSLQGIEMNLD